MRALVFGDEQPGRLPLHGRGDQHGPRLGGGLHARRDIRRLAEHFAGRVDDDGTGFEADAGGKLGQAGPGVPGVELGQRPLDRERRPHGPLGVVLLRLRIAEQRHQPVAELLQHVAAQARHRRGGLVEIGVDEIAPILGVEPRRQARRADEIAKHHRDRAALGEIRLRRLRSSGRFGSRREFSLRRRRVRGEAGDRLHQALARPERKADFLEVRFGEVGEDVGVDFVGAKSRFVLVEAETLQPLAHVHGASSFAEAAGIIVETAGKVERTLGS